MATYQAPLRDMRFVLHELFDSQELWASLPDLQEQVDFETSDAILDGAAKLAAELIAPINRSGDEEGCHWEASGVTTAKGFKAAYDAYVDGGWTAMSGNPYYGGMGMPKTLSVLCEEMLHSASASFALFPALTAGATLALDAHASDDIKALYLPKLYSGSWSGSMCLTEAHSGTDLGMIRTQAVDNHDGSYTVTGTKIFITGGEHDLTENIIHLVLAKLPDAPAGPSGISLFVVPKFLPNSDGSLGAPNRLSCGSLEHKMGIKASPTCVMNFDGAQGWLVGELNKGLACMFTMMNYERLSIGLQGVGCAEASYQNAAAYACDRMQGRAATGVTAPEHPADPIIVHPDVRRMLLTMRAYTEASRAFSVYTARQLDIAKYTQDLNTKARAEKLVALLTPVCKAFFTDKGFDACVLGQQVLGGHGYIREWGQEQLVRDSRIAQIYEGTNGIQALDLMGRKVVANNGELFEVFVAEIDAFVAENSAGALVEFTAPLAIEVQQLRDSTARVIADAQNDANAIGAASVDYLNHFGHVAYAYMWALMVKESMTKLDTAGADFYRTKLLLARFYFQRLLPETTSLAAKVATGAATTMEIDADSFQY